MSHQLANKFVFAGSPLALEQEEERRSKGR